MVVLDLVPLDEAGLVRDDLLLVFHFTLQFEDDSPLDLLFLTSFVQLDKYQLKLLNKLLLNLFQALFDINIHLAS